MDGHIRGRNDESAASTAGRYRGRRPLAMGEVLRQVVLYPIEPPTRWEQFKADVFGVRRSVQPLSGWLITGLIGLVGWLSVVYGRHFEDAKVSHWSESKGVITVEAGYITIISVALITLAVAFEPFLLDLLHKSGERFLN